MTVVSHAKEEGGVAPFDPNVSNAISTFGMTIFYWSQ